MTEDKIKMLKVISCPKCKQNTFTVSVQKQDVIRLVCEDATCNCRFEVNLKTRQLEILGEVA